MDSQDVTNPLPEINVPDENLSMSPSASAVVARPPALPTADLGTLSALPIELLRHILLDLDLLSLANFRQVNRLAAVIAALPEYRAIERHAPQVLRRIEPFGPSRRPSTTLRALYAGLRDPICDSCPEFGSSLSVVSCWRKCGTCLARAWQKNPRLVVAAHDVPAPWLRNSEAAERGFRCEACKRDHTMRFEERYRWFTEETFGAHLKRRGLALEGGSMRGGRLGGR